MATTGDASDHLNNKITPKDAQAMTSILREMGVDEFEPRLINQMLEFSYRYVTDVLEDARVYSFHACKKHIDQSDVALAIERRMDHSFSAPPPREFLVEVSRSKNAQPLPLIQEKSGLRLPPDRYCLTGNNYRLKTASIVQKKRISTSGTSSKLLINQPSLGNNSGKPGRNANTFTNVTKFRQMPIGINQQTTQPDVLEKNLAEIGLSTARAAHDVKAIRIKNEKVETSSTVASLPSMEETAASAYNQNFPTFLKRKRDSEEDNLEC